MDDDLDTMPADQLAAEVRRLRAGIRAHRDTTEQDLCWHHPALWGLLPERTDPVPAVPAWPEFLRGCVRYRQSLDLQLPDAPRVSGELRPIGVLSSELTSRKGAPKQGEEGAPDAWLDVHGWAADALLGVEVGDELVVITWLHQANRETLRVHPRSDPRNALAGVFATRSPDRPNPLGLHPVTVRAIEGTRLRLGPIEAIDGTPVVDLKPLRTC